MPLFQEAEDKNRLLRTVAGGGLETISNLKAKWDKFELMMESHQLMIKDQVRTFSYLLKWELFSHLRFLAYLLFLYSPGL